MTDMLGSHCWCCGEELSRLKLLRSGVTEYEAMRHEDCPPPPEAPDCGEDCEDCGEVYQTLYHDSKRGISTPVLPTEGYNRPIGPLISGLGAVCSEVRITNPDTGGEKCSKPERYDLIPPLAMDELARVYGWGCGKYQDRNWEKGVCWGLFIAALYRHVSAFVRGEERDPESGLHHLAHAAWHCLSLLTYTRLGLGTDDRSKLGAS